MPRPQRARRAPATRSTEAPRPADAAPPSDGEGNAEPRARTRRTRSSAASLTAQEQKSVSAANRSRDAALDRLANEDATTSGNTLEDDETESPVEVGRRAMETPAQRRDTTGLDLADDSVFGDLDNSFEHGEVPRSAETTSLSLSSFKPRSRQSSIIGRHDAPIRPSSRGGNTPSVSSTFNIGVFKRRAREPSILGTSRKARADVTTMTATTHNSELESEDDFAPEAVSTPVNRRRTRASLQAEREVSQDEQAKPASRKRKSEEAPGDAERPEKTSRIEMEVSSDDDSDSELSSLPSPVHPAAAALQRPQTPVNQDEIIAPPASSGSESEGEGWPDIHALAKRRRRPSVTTPFRAENLSDISTPPSLTHSPNYADVRGAKGHERAASRRRASPRLMTADLASLLPKRRYKKQRDHDDLDSDDEEDASGLAHDDDELTHQDARAARRRKGSRPPSRASSLRSASRSGRANQAAPQSKQTPLSARHSTRSKTRPRRSSDKENESDAEDEEEESGFAPMPDDTFDTSTAEPVPVVSSDELKKATTKFKEVDQWELSFEEMAPTSSPQGAR